MEEWKEIRFDDDYVGLIIPRRFVSLTLDKMMFTQIDFHVIYTEGNCAAICVRNDEKCRRIVEDAYCKASF